MQACIALLHARQRHLLIKRTSYRAPALSWCELHSGDSHALMQESASASSVAKRSVIVYAVKFMVVDKPHGIDNSLHAAMPGFLSHLSDPDW